MLYWHLWLPLVQPIISLANSFNVNIEFDYELDYKRKFLLLGVLLCRMGKEIYSTV